VAVRGKNNIGEIRSDGLHRRAEALATSEHTRNRAPSCLACVPARRTAIPELGHLHAFAEDRTSLAAQQEKHQLCRWLQYTRVAVEAQLPANLDKLPVAYGSRPKHMSSPEEGNIVLLEFAVFA
jgi:hypothetical protein